MLSPDELEAYCDRLNLPSAGRDLIARIRSSDPVRRPEARIGNHPVDVPSSKMGLKISGESATVEYGAIHWYNSDPDVVEMWDQPTQMKLLYRAKNGQRVGPFHTPDFFLLRRQEAGFEEWKTEKELIRLSESSPDRYQRDSEGRWRCPPGEAYTHELGLYYRLRSDKELPWKFINAFRFLKDYLRPDCPPVPQDVQDVVVSYVKDHPGVTLENLRLTLTSIATRDQINTLVATIAIYVDLHTARFAEPEKVHVFADAEIALAYAAMFAPADNVVLPSIVKVAIGSVVVWDEVPWLIVNLGAHEISLQSIVNSDPDDASRQPDEEPHIISITYERFDRLIAAGKITVVDGPAQDDAKSARISERLKKADHDDIGEANAKYREVRRMLEGLPPLDPKLSDRTLRYWRKLYEDEQQRSGDGYIALLDRDEDKGNREPRHDPAVRELLEKHAKAYKSAAQPSKSKVYGDLVNDCEAQALPVPSYKALSKAIDQIGTYELTLNRQGKRAAYPHRPKVDIEYLEVGTPRHGERPMEICHIDETQLDVETKDPETGKLLGRPWLTLLMCAFTRRILAFVLEYNRASYRTCMVLFRLLVRRYRRLPDIIVVDGGRPYHSEYFDSFLNRYFIEKHPRTGDPQRGDVIERMFGITHSDLLYGELGNTQITKTPRLITPEVDPKKLTPWTPASLVKRLESYFYGFYDSERDHIALGETPRDAFIRNLHKHGEREHIMVPDDENFYWSTLPTTARGKAKVVANKGVKMNYSFYWHPLMNQPDVVGKMVYVLYDPDNYGIGWAYLKGEWRRCISEHYAVFRGRSEQEIKQASLLLREKYRRFNRNFKVSAANLSRFLRSEEALDGLRDVRENVQNNREMLAIVGGLPTSLDDEIPETQGLQRRPNSSESKAAPQLAAADLSAATPADSQDDDTDLYQFKMSRK